MAKNTEVSKPLQLIETFINRRGTVELLGVFKNGDVEVKYTDGTLCYRIPKDTFVKKFKKVRH
jgi:hypothetical protein